MPSMRAPRNNSTDHRTRAETAAPEIRTVRAWHEALNDGEVDRLVELSHPEVEVGGPRGNGRGAQLLREWVDRANVHLEPRRIFHHADTVVVEQWAEWRSTDAGRVIDSQSVGSVFVVRDGLVTRVVRYPNLTDALDATDLDESHENKSN
jgi:ketosteroid isomerase-like protein